MDELCPKCNRPMTPLFHSSRMNYCKHCEKKQNKTEKEIGELEQIELFSDEEWNRIFNPDKEEPK